MKYHLPALLAICLLSACSSNSHNSDTQSQANYEHSFYSVGYAPIEIQSGDSFDVKMLNAIKASKLEAYKEMAEQIYGVLLSADNRVEGAMLKEDKIKAKVKGLVKGARVVKSYHEGDFYITELTLDMQALPFASNASFNEQGVSILKVEEAVYY
ncbi:hypothetical protein CW745_04965 [Psychromonas sp. psych-6C06]|uniref:LPP20 family lipoprotein n=1 Tax=Psychromonas sp. psych-6C06 TaxID=2058089 RepID=UPI000C34A1F1|nr:LPP20 family lipoprotein [Psychromonas sp. psych-6C06]PKF62776.1 hypothetical protein CW745_04965 [Psychromonas sp. psych-6C06]